MRDLITGAALAVAQALGVRLAITAASWLSAWVRRKFMGHSNQHPEFISVGQAANRLGIRTLHVCRLYERGFMPPAQRVGMRRIIPLEDLPKLKEAAKAAGYLK